MIRLIIDAGETYTLNINTESPEYQERVASALMANPPQFFTIANPDGSKVIVRSDRIVEIEEIPDKKEANSKES